VLQIIENSNEKFDFEHKAEFEAAKPQVYSKI
jgi:hypothetical protein